MSFLIGKVVGGPRLQNDGTVRWMGREGFSTLFFVINQSIPEIIKGFPRTSYRTKLHYSTNQLAENILNPKSI